jgi:hypothetical protein
MGPMRRIISLTCALALSTASGAALFFLLFYADKFRFWMPVSAGVFLFIGLYWLYADFINADPRPEQ